MPEIQKVTVLGAGVLGSQIAFQTAFHGFAVVSYDIDEAAVEQSKERFAILAQRYQDDHVPGADQGRCEQALANVTHSWDLAQAVADADLVIEAVPENIDVKRRTYEQLAVLAPEKTIFATNSSTLLPSDLKDATGRPDRFLALHYANEIWKFNTGEVMGTADTDPAVYATVVRFARDSGLEPIEIKKEKAGYLLNSLLVPFLSAAGTLLYEGIADPETIDKTWRLATGAPAGPFQIYDIVGLTTVYNIGIASTSDKYQGLAAYLKEHYIDKGKLGVATGEGFYKY